MGMGLGPVELQVEAAMLADIRRVFDVSLPTRHVPTNFKDPGLWDKVGPGHAAVCCSSIGSVLALVIIKTEL